MSFLWLTYNHSLLLWILTICLPFEVLRPFIFTITIAIFGYINYPADSFFTTISVFIYTYTYILLFIILLMDWIFTFIYLRKTNGELDRYGKQALFSVWFLKFLQWLELGQNKARSQVLNPALPYGWWGANYVSYHLWNSRNLELGTEARTWIQAFWDASVPTSILTAWPNAHFLWVILTDYFLFISYFNFHNNFKLPFLFYFSDFPFITSLFLFTFKFHTP